MSILIKQILLILLPFTFLSNSCTTEAENNNKNSNDVKKNEVSESLTNTERNNSKFNIKTESKSDTDSKLNPDYILSSPVGKILDSLKNKGLKDDFLYMILSDQNTKYNPKYIKMNVTNLFTSSGKSDYSVHYNKNGVEKTSKFIQENFDLLHLAEQKYKVPKEFIASILWVETRHGSYTGDNHILSVFLTTATSNYYETVEENKIAILDYYAENKENIKDAKSIEHYLDKYIARANKKANWAINELLALQKIYYENKLNIFDLKGSYAGAFGWSQFLPSSYNSWSVDGDNDGKTDLFNKTDAIFSVANYLKTNGFDGTEEGINKSIFHYNNSKDYVNAVITLAQKAK